LHLTLSVFPYQITDALGPLKFKLRQKESEKQRSRDSRSREEQQLATGLSNFTAEVSRLSELATTIDGYTNSDGPSALERVEADLRAVAESISQLKDRLQELQPDIARAKGMLKNQEREKSQLEFNIAILQHQETIDKLQEQIVLKEGELSSIEGHATAAAKRATALARKEEIQTRKAQLEGRYSEIVERIRQLKVRMLK
jgi:cell division septum initiation protein DivIVA